jgi:hypothetical protein
MSVQAITWALGFDVKSPTEKAILLVLANYADGDGVCFPGQDSIAAQAACTDRTVRAVLTAFEQRGVIARVHRQRRDGSRTSDEIRLVAFASANRKEMPEGQPEAASTRPTGNPRTSNRKSTSIQPEQISGLTTFEPSEEPSGEPSPVLSVAPKARRTPTPDEVDAIWNDAPRLARQRSSKADVNRSLTSALRRGHSVGAVAAGLRAAYASPSYSGDHAKGIHRLIENDRWQSFAEPEKPASSAWDDARWRSALSLHRDEGWWPDTLGPRPGASGCPAPAAILAEFGYHPHAANDPAVQGKAA